ncbi:MAG: hypothetical protein ACYC27_06450 [Armatimonadota bacterium]
MVNAAVVDPDQIKERTSFQEAGPYGDKIDIKSDVVMVYGVDTGMPDRIKLWKEKGYRIHVMTGVAWGNYQDFLFGQWDGVNHEDAGQMDRYGNEINHGPTVPYFCPTETYGKYLCVGVKRAIDAGAEAIHLEEPEFWVRAGYCEAFKREWQAYYNEPWIAPHTSPDAQYRASKLKYYLYRRALGDVFKFVQEYSKEIGRDVKCYVATHSMINYASWGIVSPESNLVLIPGCDGFIGQVWTGTSRTANMYKGVNKERTFETAFSEYGVLNNLVRSTGKRMWYLNDPIEDNGDFCWEDYRQNWESTLTASLLYPDVWRYEVAPWPSRVFNGQYPKKNLRDLAPGETVDREPIPASYATELVTVMQELNNMDQKKVSWECGVKGIGILVSDTLMFHRGEPNSSDMGSYFGISLPLLKVGAPAEPVQLENVIVKNYLKPYKTLFLTYEGQKPPTPELHDALAKWVNNGGVLVFVDADKDPYNKVKDWWNTAPMAYSTPRLHLFEKLGITTPGTHKVGKGAVIYVRTSPATFAQNAAGAKTVVDLAKQAAELTDTKWKETSYLMLNRGPFVIAAGLDETEGLPSKTLKGSYVNVFSPTLEVMKTVEITPGSRFLLKDLKRMGKEPTVVASASKILGEEVGKNTIKFHSEGPSETTCATRVILPSAPKSAEVGGKSIEAKWDADSKTALLTYLNSPDGQWVEIEW